MEVATSKNIKAFKINKNKKLMFKKSKKINGQEGISWKVIIINSSDKNGVV